MQRGGYLPTLLRRQRVLDEVAALRNANKGPGQGERRLLIPIWKRGPLNKPGQCPQGSRTWWTRSKILWACTPTCIEDGTGTMRDENGFRTRKGNS